MRQKASGLAAVFALVATGAFEQGTAKSVWAGVYTAAQAERGAELYVSTCADCHGNDLEGIEKAPALAGGTFTQRWDGTTLTKLFDRLQEMPPDNPQSRLTDAQYADVLAFLLSANSMPAGATALEPDKTKLAEIALSATQPR